MSEIGVIECSNIGQTDNGTKVEKVSDGLGSECWKASTTIDSLFGMDVDGPTLVGYGKTKEQALARLDKERCEFNDSLWV